jgi:membrane associated rhomboid family serine protease
MNSHRVLHHREWRRLGSSILLHADLPHLVNNCTGLVLEGAPLEARLGTPRFLCLLASLGLTSQALYRA